MCKIAILIASFVISVYGTGELTILHHPASIVFKGHERLDESVLKELYSAALGFTIGKGYTWAGMYFTDPFNLPEAVATIAVDGVADLGHGKGHHFPLHTDKDESEIYSGLLERVVEHNPSGHSNIIPVDLSDGLAAIEDYDFFHGIKHVKPQKNVYAYLKVNVDEDREFLQQLNLLNAIAEKVEEGVIQRDVSSSVFWFKFSGLHAVSDLHGENSTATKEAKRLLSDAIRRLNDALNKAYDGNVLVSIVSSDASHTRLSRSLLQAEDNAKPKAEGGEFDKLNLATTYSGEYPVIFNIILWFAVVMIFSLIAISIAIGSMDPGRDSIIYRMTSNRMKKDN